MFAEAFEYHAAGSLQEAISLLEQYGDDAKVVTGGMSLIPLMKLRLAAPKHLIDLRKISGLAGVSESGGHLEIGARTTHYALESSALLQAKCPLLAQTASEIGDMQVRNQGTIGGSLAHADPAADLPAAMVALEAQLTLTGKSERTVSAKDFFVDIFTTDLKPGEILTKITVPTTGKNTAYLKMPQPASGFALVGVAVCLEMDGQHCTKANIGITGVSNTVFRASAVEQALAGKSLDDETIGKAADMVEQDIEDPMEDPLNASADYRINLAKVFTARAIRKALA